MENNLIHEEDAYGFIYITTNHINGKRYIGKCLFKPGWKSYLGSGKFLVRALLKYGRENFSKEIIYIASNKEELEKVEKEYIEFFKAYKSSDWYNISRESTGGNLRAGYTEEELKMWRLKVSKGKLGQSPWNKGVPTREETKIKISRANRGNKHTTEAIEKIKISSTGRKMPKHFVMKMKDRNGEKNPFYGKTHTEEARKSMAEKRKGSGNGFSKKVGCTFKNGDKMEFDCLSDMFKYFKDEHNVSMKPLKQLLSSNDEWNPKWKKFQHLKGLKCYYVQE